MIPSADLILQEDVAAVSGGPRTIIFYFVRRCCVIHAMLSIPKKKIKGVLIYLYCYEVNFFFLLINVDVRISLRVFRLISRTLKLTTM
jgi:hypothetical protein